MSCSAYLLYSIRLQHLSSSGGIKDNSELDHHNQAFTKKGKKPATGKHSSHWFVNINSRAVTLWQLSCLSIKETCSKQKQKQKLHN